MKRKKVKQQSLFAELGEAEAAEAGWSDLKGPAPGNTVLDRVHQTMILFAAGRGELLKHLLVEDGIGKDARFWKPHPVILHSLADHRNRRRTAWSEKRCQNDSMNDWCSGLLARLMVSSKSSLSS